MLSGYDTWFEKTDHSSLFCPTVTTKILVALTPVGQSAEKLSSAWLAGKDRAVASGSVSAPLLWNNTKRFVNEDGQFYNQGSNVIKLFWSTIYEFS
jgi:hypothetical protein